jgi:hypothetical protein
MNRNREEYAMAISLLPDNPAAWTYRSWEDLMSIPREEREKLQLEAVRINFRRLRDQYRPDRGHPPRLLRPPRAQELSDPDHREPRLRQAHRLARQADRA